MPVAIVNSLSFVISLIVSQSVALDNGLALTPPMGWMSWQRFRCQVDCKNYPADCISEALIVRQAMRMVQDGWLEKGYEYIIIDDCWPMKERDTVTNRLVPDTERFPRGMKWLSDFVHDLGLKFGIYLDYGTKTCAGYPGTTEEFLELDSNTMAEWGVDYIKMDGCNSEIKVQANGYERFGRYLNTTNRPIVFSCSYPAYQQWYKDKAFNWTQLSQTCNLWRMLDDIQDSFSSLKSIMNAYEAHRSLLIPVAGPGHWNDLDMLLGGNFGLSSDETKLQMGLWAIHASPLLLSVDLERIRPELKNILQADLVIKINQDVLGEAAELISIIPEIKVWRRRLAGFNNGWALALVFLNEQAGYPKQIVTTLRELGISEEAVSKTDEVKEGMFKLISAFTGRVELQVKLSDPIDLRIHPSGILLFIAQPM